MAALLLLLFAACGADSGGSSGTTSSGTTGSGNSGTSATAPLALITAPATVTAEQAGYAASVPSQPGFTYAWSVANGTVVVGESSDSIAFRPGASGTVVFTCKVTNNSGASVTGTATVGRALTESSGGYISPAGAAVMNALVDTQKANLFGSPTSSMVISRTRISEATRQALTVRGTIVGTLPYMAPEQMAGQAADARSDLFSFGAVLYEMVTGRRAFGGDTPTAVMASVIGGQPALPRSVRPDTPAGLERLITACLAKEPADRWQSAHDAALYLDSLQDPRPEASRALPRRKAWIAATALVGVAAIGMAIGWLLGSRAPATTSAQLARLSIPLAADGPLLSPVTPRAGSSMALSRDGRRLVYRSRRNGQAMLVLRQFDRIEETVLRGTEGAFSPFFSPDGNWVAYFTESELKKVPVDGGGPVTICATAPVSRGGSWADDDTIYFTQDFTGGVLRVPSAGGVLQDVTTVDLAAKESNHLFAEALPGGEAVLFTVWKGGTFEAASVWAFSVRSRKRTLLIEGASEARYLPQGHLVFARSGTLFAVPFDPKTLALLGTPAPIVDGVWNDPTTGTAHYAVSHTGTLVYAPGQHAQASRRLAWVDRRGRAELLSIAPGYYNELKLSPDGRRLAFESLNDIWVHEFGSRTTTRITFRGVNQAPVWTPDGRHIVFSSSLNVTRPTLYWIDPTGGEEPEMLSRDGEVQFPSSWSPDGQTLAFAEIKLVNPETGLDQTSRASLLGAFHFVLNTNVIRWVPRSTVSLAWVVA